MPSSPRWLVDHAEPGVRAGLRWVRWGLLAIALALAAGAGDDLTIRPGIGVATMATLVLAGNGVSMLRDAGRVTPTVSLSMELLADLGIAFALPIISAPVIGYQTIPIIVGLVALEGAGRLHSLGGVVGLLAGLPLAISRAVEWPLKQPADLGPAAVLPLLFAPAAIGWIIGLSLKRRAEDRSALEHAQLALERSNQTLRRYAGVIAHDLKAPLATIVGFADLIEMDLPAGNPQTLDALVRIKRGGQRMANMVDGLLAYTVAQSAPLKLAEVDLNTIIEELVEDLHDLLDRTGTTVRVEPIPLVVADRQRIRQALQNVIQNSAKYADSGRASQVTISGELSEDMVTISVSDTGKGIAENLRERIFSDFERGEAAGDGLGLGLATVLEIAERHGGSVRLTSQVDVGTTVFISLPVDVAGNNSRAAKV